MMRGMLMLIVTLAAGLPGRAEDAQSAPVEVRIDSDRAVIANRFLAVEMVRRETGVQTRRIENRRARTTLSMDGDDFALTFTDGRVVRSGDLSKSRFTRAEVGGTTRLVAVGESRGVQVHMVTELRADRWWATRWLEIRGAGQLARVCLGRWRCEGASGPPGSGKTVSTLGHPSGTGQAVYAGDCFFAIAHPGAENFAADGGITCSIPAYDALSQDASIVSRPRLLGAGEIGDARRAFLRAIDRTRPVPSRMLFLVNDWYWKDKSKPLLALEKLARVKAESGVPVDTFTLDDGWDFDWDAETLIWGRLHRKRFPGGWKALEAIGKAADINVSLWFGPIGGYTYRPKRVAFAKTVGFEIQKDKLCLAGSRYKKHVIDSFSHWGKQGMDYIKVDGFWPDCRDPDHGHPVGPAGAIAQMDALIDVFAAWRRARPDLLIGYTSGSHPSPFWLQHADYVWRGGRDDSHAGVGAPFDKHNTYLDSILQAHRVTDMPMSTFVTFDIVQHRIHGNSDEVFERGCWWLAARTSLHHDWYIQASDLTLARWKTLARAARWAKQHERVFRFSRMVGGDPAKAEIYGFAAFDDGRGTLALRNPSDKPRAITSSLADLLELPAALSDGALRVRGVFGETRALEGNRKASVPCRVELAPLAIAVFEVEKAER